MFYTRITWVGGVVRRLLFRAAVVNVFPCVKEVVESRRRHAQRRVTLIIRTNYRKLNSRARVRLRVSRPRRTCASSTRPLLQNSELGFPLNDILSWKKRCVCVRARVCVHCVRNNILRDSDDIVLAGAKPQCGLLKLRTAPETARQSRLKKGTKKRKKKKRREKETKEKAKNNEKGRGEKKRRREKEKKKRGEGEKRKEGREKARRPLPYGSYIACKPVSVSYGRQTRMYAPLGAAISAAWTSERRTTTAGGTYTAGEIARANRRFNPSRPTCIYVTTPRFRSPRVQQGDFAKRKVTLGPIFGKYNGDTDEVCSSSIFGIEYLL